MKRSSPRIDILLALGAVYFIWGSTYLALRFGLEGFPPFILNGIRFSTAGLAMYGFLRFRRHPAPSRTQWINASKVALLMLVGGVGLVTIAEDLGVGSGVAATAVAVIPVWAALVSGVFGSWPGRLEWAGLAIGLSGVLLLAQEGDFRSSSAGLVLVVVAPVLWAIGSVWGTHLDLPRAGMTTAAQLLAGGAALLILGPLRGERIEAWPTTGSIVALAYLIVFGSIVAYTAYVFLLQNSRPALATSYAYVNPAVAVALGVSIGAETVTGMVFVALPLILAGVGLVGLAQARSSSEPSTVPEIDPRLEDAA